MTSRQYGDWGEKHSGNVVPFGSDQHVAVASRPISTLGQPSFGTGPASLREGTTRARQEACKSQSCEVWHRLGGTIIVVGRPWHGPYPAELIIVDCRTQSL